MDYTPEYLAQTVPQELPDQMGGAGYDEILSMLLKLAQGEIQQMGQSPAGMPYTVVPEEQPKALTDQIKERAMWEAPRGLPQKPTGKEAPKKGAQPAAAMHTMPDGTVMPGAIHPTEIAPPEFRRTQFTQPMDVPGELQNLLNALPQSLEELGGLRPQVERPEGFLQNVLASLLLGWRPGGKGAYFEEEQARLEKPWRENLEFKKERMKEERNLRIKGLELRA